MIFLIEYDRRERRVVSLRPFQDDKKEVAQNERLQLELTRKREGLEREIVLLEARDAEALRTTHWRYFGRPDRISLDEFIKRSKVILEAFEHSERTHHATNPEEWPPEREELDWWNELLAYVTYTEVEEELPDWLVRDLRAGMSGPK